MVSSWKFAATAAALFILAGCASDYSPNTYASNAVQLANKVEAGTIVGFREVMISASGNVGAVTGGAAGGLLGSEYGNSALAAVGGTTVGAMVGSALDHAAGDTHGWEYIVRKASGDMLSVTQKEKKPLDLGQHVLVIIGPQARVVPDYSVPPEPPASKVESVKAEAKPEPKESNVKVEVVLSLPPGVTAQTTNGAAVTAQTVTVPVASEDAPASTPAPLSAGVQATSIKTNSGQTVVVHVPVGIVPGLVPAAAAADAGLVSIIAGGDAKPAAGTITAAPEESAPEEVSENAAPPKPN